MSTEVKDLQVVDAVEYDSAARNEVVEVKYNSATIETVKRTVFPGSSDDELRIYLYKCLIFGVHPLSGMLIPVKYKDKLSFTTTIDCFRSKAQESGEYDGQDDVEVLGKDSFEYEGNTIHHPVECKVSVFRKNISRPFVGTARWEEFYPGDSRGMMWRKMPLTMLAKCAEAQAIRKAFPDKLNRIYAVEEMEQAADDMGRVTASKRNDNVPLPQLTSGSSATSDETPDEDTRKKNKWISKKQETRLYAICKSKGVDANTLKAWFRMIRKDQKAHLWMISWARNGDVGSEYDRICAKIESEPGYFAANAPKAAETNGNAPAGSKAPETATTPTRQQFEATVAEMRKFLAWDDNALEAAVNAALPGRTCATIEPENYGVFLGAMNKQLEEQSAENPGA